MERVEGKAKFTDPGRTHPSLSGLRGRPGLDRARGGLLPVHRGAGGRRPCQASVFFSIWKRRGWVRLLSKEQGVEGLGGKPGGPGCQGRGAELLAGLEK